MTKLRVATYNLHSCIGGDRRYDPDRILHVMNEIGADIYALQELGGLPVEGREQAHFFEANLGMVSALGLKPKRMRIQHINAVLVKGEIETCQLIDLTVFKFEPRNAIDCIVRTAAGRLRIIATHLGLFSPERRRQIARLKEVVDGNVSLPTLILGDFNIFGRERNILYAIGAPKPLPVLRSFPARRPLMSLDRLWTIPNRHLVNLHLHRTPLSRLASDHLPLVGELEL